MLASLHLPWYFVRGQSGFQFEQNSRGFRTRTSITTLASTASRMWLVVLTTFLMPLCVLISWKSIDDRVKEFFILMLILETAMIGVFVALDLFLFYFFWEATLIPMALLIGMYGHGRKIYAAVKFFLYTMIASVFMLAAIIWLYARTGSFDFVTIQSAIQNGQVSGVRQRGPVALPGIFCSFRGEGSAFPGPYLAARRPRGSTDRGFGSAGRRSAEDGHLWPAALQRRACSLSRLAATPRGSWRWPSSASSTARWWRLVQPNIKRLIAYTSVSHLGFVVLGIFSFTQLGVDGAVYQMLNHGVSTGALFMLLGMIYERRHTYDIAEYGGLATPMPIYATFFAFIMLSSVGLPLLNGFIGEFLILSGAFQARQIYGILAATGVIWSAATCCGCTSGSSTETSPIRKTKACAIWTRASRFPCGRW